jgi:hypothetical protein
MAPELWSLATLSAAGLANVAVQIGLYRVLSGQGRLLKSQVAGAAAGLAVLLVPGLAGSLPSSLAASPWSWIADLLIYLAFCYIYFHWNNMGETARRIRLLRELAEAADGLSEAELLARYPGREILDRRLTRLIDGGQIVERDGRLQLSGGLVLVSARLVGLAKAIVIGGRSELDRFDHVTLRHR